MKNLTILFICAFLFLIVLGSVEASSFYFSQSGNDSQACNVTNPCKTIARVNNITLVKGDIVSFNRSDIWRVINDSYHPTDVLPNLVSGVTYTAFGTGNKPEFWGSLNFSNTSLWINVGNGLWSTVYNISYDVGNILLNSTTGTRVQNYADLTSQAKWNYNETTNNFTINSSSNPATYYSFIEIAVKPADREMMFKLDDKGNITISNLSMKYTGSSFINGERMNNISILDNDLRYGGGDWQTTTRYGNCIDVQVNASNIEIARNNVSQCYDGAITIEGYSSGGQSLFYNISIHNNVLTYSHYGIEYFNSVSTSKIDNLNINHNTILHLGEQWAYNERFGTGMITTSRNRFASTPVNSTNINFTDNLVSVSKDYAFWMGDNSASWKGPKPNLDYNLYWNSSGVAKFGWNGTDNIFSLVNFSAASTKDTHSVEANPLMNEATYKPATNSPACTMSSIGSYVGAYECDAPDVVYIYFDSPSNNSNVTRNVNITWTDALINVSYNVTLLNSNLSYNRTIANNTNNLNNTYTYGYNYGGTDTWGTMLTRKSVSLGLANYVLGNVTFDLTGTSYSPDQLAYARLIFYYSDGSASTSSIVSTGVTLLETNVPNPYPSKAVSSIALQGYASTYSGWSNTNLSFTSYVKDKYINYDLLAQNMSVGVYYINVSAYNYSNSYIISNITAINVTSNALLNISARSFFGGVITSFNVSLISGSTIVNYSVSNGSVLADVVLYTNYTVNVSSTSYVNGTMNINITNRTINSTLILYPAASVLVSIYNEMDSKLINETINITVTDVTNPYVVKSTSANGTVLIENLPVYDLLEFKFVSENYSQGRNYLVILPSTYNTLNVYLLPNADSSNFSICWYDSNGVPIYGLHAYQYYLSNTSYVLTQDVFSDLNGKTNYIFSTSHYYLYNISSSTYANYPFILNPPQNSALLSDGCNYDITLSFLGSTTTFRLFDVNGSAYFNNVSKLLTFSYVSNEAAVSNYNYVVTKIISGKEYTICNESSPLTSNSFSCNLAGYYGSVYVGGYADGKIFFGGYVTIEQSPSLFDNLTPEDSAYYSGFIMLLIIFAGIIAGPISVLIVSVLGLIVIGWLGIMTPITTLLIIVDVVISLVIAFGLKRRY